MIGKVLWTGQFPTHDLLVDIFSRRRSAGT